MALFFISHRKNRSRRSGKEDKAKSEGKSLITSTIRKVLLSNYIFEVEKKQNSEKVDRKTSDKATPVWRGPRTAPSQVDQARKKKNKHRREGGDQSNKQGKEGGDQSNEQGMEGGDQPNKQVGMGRHFKISNSFMF